MKLIEADRPERAVSRRGFMQRSALGVAAIAVTPAGALLNAS
jgi:hypothetical protein